MRSITNIAVKDDGTAKLAGGGHGFRVIPGGDRPSYFPADLIIDGTRKFRVWGPEFIPISFRSLELESGEARTTWQVDVSERAGEVAGFGAHTESPFVFNPVCRDWSYGTQSEWPYLYIPIRGGIDAAPLQDADGFRVNPNWKWWQWTFTVPGSPDVPTKEAGAIDAAITSLDVWIGTRLGGKHGASSSVAWSKIEQFAPADLLAQSIYTRQIPAGGDLIFFRAVGAGGDGALNAHLRVRADI